MKFDFDHDHDISVRTLLELWAKGERDKVIDQLWSCPPHVTALFIAMGVEQFMVPRAFKRDDVNFVANLLMDRFIKERDA